MSYFAVFERQNLKLSEQRVMSQFVAEMAGNIYFAMLTTDTIESMFIYINIIQ